MHRGLSTSACSPSATFRSSTNKYIFCVLIGKRNSRSLLLLKLIKLTYHLSIEVENVTVAGVSDFWYNERANIN